MPAHDGDTHVMRARGSQPFKVTVAASPAAIQKGLSGTPHLPSRQGLFFVFPSLEKRSMWMPDMKFALDIVWLDEQLSVVHVNKAVPPCGEPDQSKCPSYFSNSLVKYAVELNAGAADALGLHPGAQVELLT